MTKQTKWHVRPAKTQISLGILRAQAFSMRTAKTLIRLLVLSCRGSFLFEAGHDYLDIRLSRDLNEQKAIIKRIFGPRQAKMCLRTFSTRYDSNRSAQLQRVARVLKFQV